MGHVVTEPMARFSAMNGRAWVLGVPVHEDNLVWLLACAETGECAVVDGPPAVESVLDTIAAQGWSLTTILNTHTHWDHIGINQGLQKAGKLPPHVVGCGDRAADIPGHNTAVDEGSVVTVGRLQGRVLRTDGHMNGHVSYVFGDVLFCGDTLFAGGCGYLFDGPASAMFDSLMRLASLPGETKVCCAHEYTEDNLRFAHLVEPDNAALNARIAAMLETRGRGACTVPSTIALEQATNPFLRPGAPTLVATVARHLPEAVLDTPGDVFAATRLLKNQGPHKTAPWPPEAGQ